MHYSDTITIWDQIPRESDLETSLHASSRSIAVFTFFKGSRGNVYSNFQAFVSISWKNSKLILQIS